MEEGELADELDSPLLGWLVKSALTKLASQSSSSGARARLISSGRCRGGRDELTEGGAMIVPNLRRRPSPPGRPRDTPLSQAHRYVMRWGSVVGPSPDSRRSDTRPCT